MTRSLTLSDRCQALLACCVLIALPLFYGFGQEIHAIPGGHDDYYFLMRSESFVLFGNYLAPIKEYLYSLFISIPRLAGINLRAFEAFCYGAGLFWLWRVLRGWTGSTAMAWLTVLPLAFFTYQHPVFNRATADALQLILMPLTLASSLQLILSRGRLPALLAAALVAALQLLARPEGGLLLLPPLVALAWLAGQERRDDGLRRAATTGLRRAVLLCLLPLLLQQGMSAVNYRVFGFWAPNIMKSAPFSDALTSLMAIQPEGGRDVRYAPVPKSALQRALAVSPTLNLSRSFWVSNMNGQGWSRHALSGYRPEDGSIGGGHFQWAFYAAAAAVVGTDSRAILAYLRQIDAELDAAFADGRLARRKVLTTSLAPGFSLLDSHYWLSVGRLGWILLNGQAPHLPAMATVGRDQQIEADFDRVAQRRAAWLAGSDGRPASPVAGRAMAITTGLSIASHQTLRLLLVVAAVWLAVLAIGRRRLSAIPPSAQTTVVALSLSLAVVVPRLALLAGIDATMYPGDEPRYLSAAAFALWFLAAFTLAQVLVVSCKSWRNRVAARRGTA